MKYLIIHSPEGFSGIIYNTVCVCVCVCGGGFTIIIKLLSYGCPLIVALDSLDNWLSLKKSSNAQKYTDSLCSIWILDLIFNT